MLAILKCLTLGKQSYRGIIVRKEGEQDPGIDLTITKRLKKERNEGKNKGNVIGQTPKFYKILMKV